MDALSFSLNGPPSLPCAGLMGDSDHPYSKFENEWSGRSGGAESFPSLLASSDASFSQTSPPDRMLDPPHQSLWFTCLIISNLKIEMKLYFAFRFLFCVLRVDQMLNLVLKVPFFFFFLKWSHDLSLFTILVWYWTAICTHSIDLLNKDVCKRVLVNIFL